MGLEPGAAGGGVVERREGGLASRAGGLAMSGGGSRDGGRGVSRCRAGGLAMAGGRSRDGGRGVGGLGGPASRVASPQPRLTRWRPCPLYPLTSPSPTAPPSSLPPPRAADRRARKASETWIMPPHTSDRSPKFARENSARRAFSRSATDTGVLGSLPSLARALVSSISRAIVASLPSVSPRERSVARTAFASGSVLASSPAMRVR